MPYLRWEDWLIKADRDDRSEPAIILELGRHQNLPNPNSFELSRLCLSASLPPLTDSSS